MKAPSFATFGNFIRNELTTSVEKIFADTNRYIFEKEQVDLEHAYIDGTKIEANANRYTWVWKKSCIRNRDKVFEKVLDIDLSALKIEDRMLLEEGIILGTKDALLSLIEDYSS